MTDLAGREIETTPDSPAPRRRPDRVLVAGLALVVVATAFRAWTTSRTWFYIDDFPLIDRMSRFGLRAGDLLDAHNGHLMPSGRVAAWLISLGQPWDYRWAVVELAVLFALAGVGVLMLLRTLFGSRPAILGLLVFFLLSPWLVPATTWWAAGINHLPALAATAWALNALVKQLRSPSRRHVMVSVAWMAFGLSFAELSLIGYIPMTIVAVGYFASGSLRQRVAHLWRRQRAVLFSHGLLLLIYVPAYLVLKNAAPQSGDRPWRVYLIDMLGTVVPGTALGGPVRWAETAPAQFEVQPPILLQLLGIAVLAGLVTLGVTTRVRSLRAWSIPVTVAIGIVVLFGQNRVFFGPHLILDLRFSVPLALAFTLAIGLALLPVPGAVECSAPADDPRWSVRPAWAGAAVLAYSGLAVTSAVTYPLLHQSDPSPRHFFSRFEANLAAHDQPVDLLDGSAPKYVYDLWTLGRYSTLLSAYGDKVRFPEVVQDDFFVVNDDGNLVRPGLDVARRARQPEASAGCDGYRVAGAGATIPLDGPVFGYAWQLRLEYTATRATPARLSYGGAHTDVTLRPGSHVLETGVAAPDTWEQLEIDGLDPGAEVCVSRTLVGQTTVPDA